MLLSPLSKLLFRGTIDSLCEQSELSESSVPLWYNIFDYSYLPGKEGEAMKKIRFKWTALTLALCLGLTVPAFAAAIDGITITANPNGTLSYAALAK